MNKNLKTILCAALALVIALLPLHMGVNAEIAAEQPETRGVYYSQYEDWPCEADREKLLAFWNIVDENTGISNGEAVFITDFPTAWLEEIGGSEYGGTAVTPLIHIEHWYAAGTFDFHFTYELDHMNFDPDDPFNDPVACVLPELHGDLDLSGTEVRRVGDKGICGPAHTTHIESIHLNGCEKLESVYICHEAFCTEVSALDCPELWGFKVVNSAARTLAFTLDGIEEAIEVGTFGRGCIGCWYQNANNEMTGTLIAYPDAPFTGWFEDGELVSMELEYVRTEGGSLTAVFGGDADGDGAITVADALLAMRCAMGVAESDSAAMVDVNGSGDADVADALLIMRFAMGLI
ncbi:MAG: dockerin type I repeat-containing protein [Clostridia bacterium]|nr:dockerin type I repeat-containing protein [Clostridia bacterium]MBQ2111145.1 dockerin type I repeat-containing protein [Clostridia bacterium]